MAVATALVVALIEAVGLSELLSAGPGALLVLLSELVVAALTSYVLALEAMGWNQWAGGAMIVAATLLSGRLGQDHA